MMMCKKDLESVNMSRKLMRYESSYRDDSLGKKHQKCFLKCCSQSGRRKDRATGGGRVLGRFGLTRSSRPSVTAADLG